jgi:hypothetical protein
MSDTEFTVEYVPPPQPDPGHVVITPPKDSRGLPRFPTLHLTEDEAYELHAALGEVLNELTDQRGHDA